MNKLLDKYRSTAAAPEVIHVEGQPYQAIYSRSEPVRRIQFFPHSQAPRILPFHDLRDFMYAAGEICVFYFTHVNVQIEGRNLWDIAALVQDERLEGLIEFYPKGYRCPAEGEPLIEKMTFTEFALPQRQVDPTSHH